jgi:hypothetical protein
MGIRYPDDFAIKTQLFRDGYNLWPDVDEYVHDLYDLPGGENLWLDTYRAPKILKTVVQPVGDLWRRTENLLLSEELLPLCG